MRRTFEQPVFAVCAGFILKAQKRGLLFLINKFEFGGDMVYDE